MIKKLTTSAMAVSLLCSALAMPLNAGLQDVSEIDYIITDESDYGEQIYAYDTKMPIYGAATTTGTTSEEDRMPPLEDIETNSNIIGLDESVIKIMIDPGHYGYYNPSPVYKSYYESVMNWKLSNYLKAELEALGAHADITKTSLDDNPDLIPRGHMSKGYDFFISIHSNAASYSSIDKPVAICYQDVEWTDIDDTSREIGQLLADKVADVMDTYQEGEIYQRLSVEDRDGNGVWDDEWYGVLCGARYVQTPGVLLEHSFHTNYRATAWLSNDANLQKMAKEEAALLVEYFTEKKAEEAAAATTVTSETTVTETTTTTVRTDPVPSENAFPGDVDGNGAINLDDAVLVLEYYAYNAAGVKTSFIRLTDDPEGEQLIFNAADIIEDENVDLSDAVEILRIYAENAAGTENDSAVG